MNAKKSLKLLLLLFAIPVVAAGCQSADDSPRSLEAAAQATDAAATEALLERSAREASTRAAITKASDALDTLSIAAGDAINLLDLAPEIVEKIRRSIFGRIQVLLREATTGWVEHHADGSWLISRQIKLRDLELRCRDYLIGSPPDFVGFKVQGQREGGNEVIRVRLNGCGFHDEDDLATIIAQPDGRVDVSFDSEQLEEPRVEPESFHETSRCALGVSGDWAGLVCLPGSLELSRHTVGFKNFSLTIERGGWSGSVRLEAQDREARDAIAILDFKKDRDSRAGVKACAGREKCIELGLLPKDQPSPEASVAPEPSPMPSPEPSVTPEPSPSTSSSPLASSSPEPSPNPESSPEPEPSPSPMPDETRTP